MACILEEKSTFVSEASEKKRASNLALILSLETLKVEKK